MIKILYQDKMLVVCVKPVGILSEIKNGQKTEKNEKSLADLLKAQTRAYNIGVVQRLDRNVGGTIIYSKSSKITFKLIDMMKHHRFNKEYLAVVKGILPLKQGKFEDYLRKDKFEGKVSVAKEILDTDKYAALEYKVLAEKDGMSLVKIKLITGRTHQIRVQFASRGFSIFGDGKYGSRNEGENIALWSYRILFKHPLTEKNIDIFEKPPNIYPFSLFNIEELLKS